MIQKMNRLKIILAEKGISNDEFAKMMNTTPKTVSNWVTNKNQPSMFKLYQWAFVLGIEPGAFFYPMKDVGNIPIIDNEE
jgi:transcriptional regulator with XRE-family HTH domain